MHDTLDYMSNEPIYRQYHHHQMTFSMMYAYSENFVLPISHDEVVHGKGSLLRKMPGDRWQQLANLRALPRLHVGAPRQAAAVHGLGVRPGVGVGRVALAGLVADRQPRPPRRAATGQRPEPASTGDTRALWTQDADPARLPAGSTPTTPATTCSPSCAGATTARCWPASPTSPAIPHEGYRLGLPARRPLGRGAQHRRRGVRRLRGRQPGRGRGRAATRWHGQPASATLRVPPLGTVWLHRAAG